MAEKENFNNGFSQELEDVFLAESADLLDELTLLIESAKRYEIPPKDLLISLMGVAHGLKGIAGAVQNAPVVELSHVFEEVCGEMIRDASAGGTTVVNALAQAVSVLERTIQQRSLAAGYSDSLETLRAFCVSNASDTAPVTGISAVQNSSDGLVKKADAGEGLAEAIGGGDGTAEIGNELQTLRIPLQRLEHMMEQMEEMAAVRTRLLAQFEDLVDSVDEVMGEKNPGTSQHNAGQDGVRKVIDGKVRSYRESLVQYGYLVDEIGVTVKQLRMISLSSVQSRWRQIVADAAQREQKLIQFQANLGNTELDKAVLQKVQDSISHLLRNAVAHGIETSGIVSMAAHSSGSFIRLTISDDGKGIDTDQIFQLACDKKLATPAEANVLNQQEKLSFLFVPGFSTAHNANFLRGRGIGLDVVKRTMESLGGNIEISTELGKGSSFTMIIPATLMGLDGLIFRSGDTYCVIPVEYIQRTLRVAVEEVVVADGGMAVSIGGEPLRLFHLSAFLQQPDPKVAEGGNLIVLHLQLGTREIGIIIDSIVENSTLVIRALPWNIQRLPGVSGATFLSDGSVGLLLDVAYLFDTSARSLSLNSGNQRVEKATPTAAHILVVDDSITMRALHQNILKSHGYRTSVAENGEEAMMLLENRKETFDLVVTDVQMPVMDGFELTRRIRRSESVSKIPVILVTNLHTPEDIEKGMHAGANEYIVKRQFDQQQLINAIERLV